MPLPGCPVHSGRLGDSFGDSLQDNRRRLPALTFCCRAMTESKPYWRFSSPKLLVLPLSCVESFSKPGGGRVSGSASSSPKALSSFCSAGAARKGDTGELDCSGAELCCRWEMAAGWEGTAALTGGTGSGGEVAGRSSVTDSTWRSGLR